jgi:molybdopterin converting factor subunit 1
MVSVRLFAGFKEKINKDTLEIRLNTHTTLEDFIINLGESFPQIAEILENNQATIAVNHEIVDQDYILKDSDEIALFPPVSGG